MSPWQPPVSFPGVCRVQRSHSQIPLLSAPRECVRVFVCCVFNQHVWRAPYRWPSLKHTQTHTVRSEPLLTESFEVWQWELDRIRQAAAVWYSCHPLPIAAVSGLKLNQSPLAFKPQSTPTHDLWLPPFAPVTHAFSSHRKMQARTPPLPIWTPALLFSSWSTVLLIIPSTSVRVHSLSDIPSFLGPHFIAVVRTRTSLPCSAWVFAKFLLSNWNLTHAERTNFNQLIIWMFE